MKEKYINPKKRNSNQKSFTFYFTPLLSGLMVVLSMPPFGATFLCWICLVPILYKIRNYDKFQIIFTGYSFGFFCFGIMMYSLIPYSLPGYIIAVLSLPCVLVIVFLIINIIYSYFKNQTIQLFLVPIFWVAIEYLCTLAYLPISHGLFLYKNTHLIQICNITGVYGISFLIWFINNAISIILFSIKNKNKFKQNSYLIMVVIIFIVMVLSYNLYSLRESPFPKVNKINIAILQDSDIELHYENSTLYPHILNKAQSELFQLTESALKAKPDFIIWPESALKIFTFRIPPIRRKLIEIAHKNGCHLLVGSFDRDENLNCYNSIFHISPKNESIKRFDKAYLIPYFESPYFVSGAVTGSCIQTEQVNFAGMICFESAFNHIAQKKVKNLAQAILILSDSGGMKYSVLPLLHKATAIFRAVENKRYTLFAANSGISMIIDPYGRIVNETKLFEKTILTGQIIPISDLTFFTRFGNLFSVLCLLSSFLTFIFLIISRKIKKR